MASSNGGGPGDGKGPGPKQLDQVNVTAIVPHQKYQSVGGVKQDRADVAKAVASLNKYPLTKVGSSDLSGHNATSDNINMLIAKRKQVTGGNDTTTNSGGSNSSTPGAQ